MSGPKYSDFHIESARRRQLELERQRRLEEERKKKQLQQSIQLEENNLKNVVNGLCQSLEQLLYEAKINKLDERVIFSDLARQLDQINEKYQNISWKYDVESIPNMEAQLEKLKKLQNEFLDENQSKINELAKHLDIELTTQREFTQQQQLLNDLSEMKRTEKKTFDLSGLSRNEMSSNKDEAQDVQTLVNQVYEQITPYLEDQNTYFYNDVKQLYDSVCSIRDNENYDNAYKIKRIELRLKTFLSSKRDYDEVLEKIAKDQKEYEDLFIEYQSLCSLLKEKENPMFAKRELANKEQLKAEIENLHKKHIVKQEMEYIVESVHEVMKKLGYEILATDYMEKKKRNVHHQIYEFGYDQAVNVFVSDNGSILFEVSGIGEGDSEMTSLEKLKVKEAMDAFCTHYEDIKEELEKKGIYLKNENLFPADEKYARKIDISSKTILKNRSTKSHRNKVNQAPKSFN